MLDEGYIKFNCDWKKMPPLAKSDLTDLIIWRQAMYRMGLIGAYANGIGFGNISARYHEKEFVISGSATGNFEKLNEAHFTKVTQFDLNKNSLYCEGPIIASSESLSHAVIYQQCDWVNGVIHVHHLEMWKQLLHKVPTTSKTAAYGTPEMANSIIQLLKETDLQKQRIFVMEGHEEGIFAFGENLEMAANVIINHSK